MGTIIKSEKFEIFMDIFPLKNNIFKSISILILSEKYKIKL